MDMGWGTKEATKFVTNVGLITSYGSHGENIMAAEWTHAVSYSPGLIAVCIGPGKATAENISETKEFGVSLAAEDQNVISSVSGMKSGKNVNKISVLKELGFKFSKAKKIKALLVEGAALNLECKLVNKIQLGSHTMFVGEIIEMHPVSDKSPLAYHGLKYWKLTEQVEKPSQQEMDKINLAVNNNSK